MMSKGTGMLLKSMGFDPEEIGRQIDTVKRELPVFAAGLKQKVDSMDARLEAIEKQQTEILELLRIVRDRSVVMESRLAIYNQEESCRSLQTNSHA